jgi:hypothetical protein
MKNVILLFAIAGLLVTAMPVKAGEDSLALTATKLCGKSIEVFNVPSIEALLGLEPGKKLSAYEVVLASGDWVYKYQFEPSGQWTYERIMKNIKEHAKPGAMLFIDEAKTSDNQPVEQTGFYLR